MNKLLLSLMMVLGLSACATQGNFSSRGNDQQFAYDRAQCRLATSRNFPTNSYFSDGVLAQIANVKQQNASTEFYNDCMTAAGYSANGQTRVMPVQNTPTTNSQLIQTGQPMGSSTNKQTVVTLDPVVYVGPTNINNWNWNTSPVDPKIKVIKAGNGPATVIWVLMPSSTNTNGSVLGYNLTKNIANCSNKTIKIEAMSQYDAKGNRDKSYDFTGSNKFEKIDTKTVSGDLANRFCVG